MARAPLVMRWQAAWALRRQLGSRVAAEVLRTADERYVAPPDVARTSTGRFNLEMGAYLLALRDALAAVGYEPAKTNALLAQSLYTVMRRFYRPMDTLALLIHPANRLARARWRQRVSRRFFFKRPDWLMAEVATATGYGFDVRRCLLAEFMKSRGEQQFCRDVFCMQDLLMAEVRKEVLVRTRYIAAGDDRCDFRLSAAPPGRVLLRSP